MEFEQVGSREIVDTKPKTNYLEKFPDSLSEVCSTLTSHSPARSLEALIHHVGLSEVHRHTHTYIHTYIYIYIYIYVFYTLV